MTNVFFQFFAFCRNSLLEALRNKVLYAVVAAALLAIGGASALGALSLNQEERLFNNLVFFAGMLFLVVLAIYQGVTSLHREIETRTIFTVLSKPVTKPVFLAGKFTASAVVLTVCAVILFGLKVIVALYLGYDVTSTHFAAYFSGLLQVLIVLAVANFFASFSGPLLSALLTFCIFLLGSLTPQLESAIREFSSQGNPVYLPLTVALRVVPDLEKLNLSFELTHHLEVPLHYIGSAALYTSTNIFFILLFTFLVFHRRDFA